MSSVSGNIKGFYRQRKTSNSNNKSSKKPPIPAASYASDVAQPPSLTSRTADPDLQEEFNESEAMLRQFDLNMAYGPCLGMTRLARWERAQKLGLNPPQEIERLLKSGKVQTESLWNGLI